MTAEACRGMHSKLIDSQDDRFENEGEDRTNISTVQHSTPVWTTNTRFRYCSYRTAAITLAVLCTVSLAFLIAVYSHYKNITSGFNKEQTALSQNYSTVLGQLEQLTVNFTTLDNANKHLQKEKTDIEKDRDRLQSRVSELEEKKMSSVCPDEWMQFNNSCYYISTTIKSWKDSQNFCLQNGGHLPIILTPEEQTFIWTNLPRGHWNAYWIGISDEKAEDDWYWVDGTKLVGGFWRKGEPNNHIDEDCGYVVKTLDPESVALESWNDAPCEMYWPFICEAEKKVVTLSL